MTDGIRENVMWENVADWMRRHHSLKGARMILGIMDQWAETVNVFENLIGCAHEDAVIHSGEAGYPLAEAEIEMADAQTIADCQRRLARLEEISRVRLLTPEEEGDQRSLTSYLKEVSFKGRPRKFSNSSKRDFQRNIENLRYAIAQLGKEHQDLAEYVRRHVQTSPAFRWV